MSLNRKSMALVLVLLISFSIAILSVIMMSHTNSVTKQQVKEFSTKQVEFLNKGVMQLALLKIKLMPIQFYDACRWYLGVKSETKADLTKKWEYIPSVIFTAAGTQKVPDYLYAFLGDLKVILDPDTYSDPFEGSAKVMSIFLLGQKSTLTNDSMYIRTFGKIKSLLTNKEVQMWNYYTINLNWVIKK